jgi:hypothetical protein
MLRPSSNRPIVPHWRDQGSDFHHDLSRRRKLQSPEAQSLPARGLETMMLTNPKRGRHGIVTATSVEKALSSPLESKAVTQ